MKVVVGAALIRDGRVLAACRTAPPEARGRWEFPGGKVEAGEAPEAALARELREELGVEARVLHRLPGAAVLRPGLELQLWTATIVRGEPRALQDHSALRWLAADQLEAVDWLEQDRFGLPHVARLLAATGAADGETDAV